MTKHTPGPWKYDGRDIFPPAMGQTIATTWDIGRTSYERHANGHLIAAAPDLLAACETIISSLDGPGPHKRTFVQGVKLAEAAIHKAKGKDDGEGHD